MSEWIDPDTDRDFRTVVPPWMWEQHYLSLGKFMDAFARAEDGINSLSTAYLKRFLFPAQKLTKLDKQEFVALRIMRDGLVRALPIATNFDMLRSTINRLLKHSNATNGVKLEVKSILDHFSEIQKIRNRLAHHPATPDRSNKEGWFCVGNRNTVSDEENYELIFFKSSMLLAMARDLEAGMERLEDALDVHELNQAIESDPFYQGFMNSPVEKERQADIRGPWHYKPHELRIQRPLTRSDTRTPPR